MHFNVKESLWICAHHATIGCLFSVCHTGRGSHASATKDLLLPRQLFPMYCTTNNVYGTCMVFNVTCLFGVR